MPSAVYAAVFIVGTVFSLSSSWVLVSRIERIGERFHLSEALLGLIAAVAADMPEITSAITAASSHQRSVSTGVVLGSNLFNLAALLGLAALAAGTIALHCRVVELLGAVAVLVALCCELAVTGAVPPLLSLLVALAVVGGYGYLAAVDVAGCLSCRPVPPAWRRWLAAAIGEEDEEVEALGRPVPAVPLDWALAAGALVVVIAASAAMERAATTLGVRWNVSGIVTGAVVLAAVTSLPNAVAALYLARRGRGMAVLSTALNSNAVNVLAGLLIPGVILGLGAPALTGTLVASWYLGLTAASLLIVLFAGGISRFGGSTILIGYGAFLVALLGIVAGGVPLVFELAPAAAASAAMAIAVAADRRRPVQRQPPPLPPPASASAAKGEPVPGERGRRTD